MDWFNLLLVIFNGALVLVGVGQCFLFFYTLRATRIAADAAKKSADVAQQSLIDLEGPFLYPVIENETVQFKRLGHIRVHILTVPTNQLTRQFRLSLGTTGVHQRCSKPFQPSSSMANPMMFTMISWQVLPQRRL